MGIVQASSSSAPQRTAYKPAVSCLCLIHRRAGTVKRRAPTSSTTTRGDPSPVPRSPANGHRFHHSSRPAESPTEPTRSWRPDLLPRGSDPRIQPAPRESLQRRRGRKPLVFLLCSRIGGTGSFDGWIRCFFPLKAGLIGLFIR